MRWSKWLIGACLALDLVVVLTPTGFYVGAWTFVSGKDAPAWVQAVGSIAALVAAIMIALHDTIRQQAKELKATGPFRWTCDRSARWSRRPAWWRDPQGIELLVQQARRSNEPMLSDTTSDLVVAPSQSQARDETSAATT